MSDVVSFRPSPQEEELIERTRRSLRLKSRAAAVRYLVRRGAEPHQPVSQDPVFRFRVDLGRKGRPWTSDDIDRELYGD